MSPACSHVDGCSERKRCALSPGLGRVLPGSTAGPGNNPTVGVSQLLLEAHRTSDPPRSRYEASARPPIHLETLTSVLTSVFRQECIEDGARLTALRFHAQLSLLLPPVPGGHSSRYCKPLVSSLCSRTGSRTPPCLGSTVVTASLTIDFQRRETVP